MTAHENLKQYFGYDTFRDGQETLINDILSKKDVLGIMPTGAGKSVCFQIPALMLNGLTLIVSPLISLMKDQVNALNQVGIAAAFINSSLTERQINTALYNARIGAYKLIYIAPERLLTYDFLSFAHNTQISMLTVDEAHCISQWGQDFRPSYAKIPQFIAGLKERPVVSAFTATATPAVREDIINQLGLQTPSVLVAGFDRQNLYFEVKKPKDKFLALTSFLEKKKDRAGIVYCSTRAAVEDVCDRLKQNGYNVSRYHAGLSDSERHNNQDDFLYDRVQIIIATNAFGMGIDKSNVSYVVHYNMPRDIESYYQEAGRAGRDGEPADCILLYSGQDVRTHLWLIENTHDKEYPDKETEEKLKERDRERLRKMTFYCSASDCLRGYILRYFGETPPNHCGNCRNCNTNFETADITVEAQKILSCIIRMKERYGVTMIIDVLRGSKSEKVSRLGLDRLSTYGISEKNVKHLHEITNHLLLTGYLIKTDDKYPVIKIGQCADEILRGRKRMHMKLSKEELETIPRREEKQRGLAPVDKRLFGVLSELRLTIAKEQNVPAFVIFANSTLTDMCMKLPSNIDEFLNVSGVGKVKAEQYGKQFLGAISEFIQNNKTNLDEPKDLPLKEFDTLDVEISEEQANVSTIADRINCVLLESGYKKITGQRINAWLLSGGYIEIAEINGKNHKVPTDAGAELGITSEDRIIKGESIKINLYASSAQKYIVENVLKILDFNIDRG